MTSIISAIYLFFMFLNRPITRFRPSNKLLERVKEMNQASAKLEKTINEYRKTLYHIKIMHTDAYGQVSGALYQNEEFVCFFDQNESGIADTWSETELFHTIEDIDEVIVEAIKYGKNETV